MEDKDTIINDVIKTIDAVKNPKSPTNRQRRLKKAQTAKVLKANYVGDIINYQDRQYQVMNKQGTLKRIR